MIKRPQYAVIGINNTKEDLKVTKNKTNTSTNGNHRIKPQSYLLFVRADRHKKLVMFRIGYFCQ